MVRSAVPIECFDSYYRAIVDEALKFWAKFKEPPGEHTLDLIDDLRSRDSKNNKIFTRIYRSMVEIKDELNTEYLISKASDFIRLQKLKAGITEAVDLIQNNRGLDEIESVLSLSMNSSYSLFDPGTHFTDVGKSLKFLNNHVESFPTGIEPLDNRQLGPVRKELHLLAGAPKHGKTWWLVNLGRQAIASRLKVVHITLELSEERCCQRYVQSFFSVSKRREVFKRLQFVEDSLGRLIDLRERTIPQRPSFNDKNIRQLLVREVKSLKNRPALIIKQFPTGDLTVHQLDGYLDNLELSQQFIPDLVIVDYADLFRLNTENYRLDLGRVYKDLRGMAIRRNIAVATASQLNRVGSRARTADAQHTAEDFSKVGTVDTLITYNRTDAEKRRGLARLFVVAARNDEDRFMILISQNYALGQFAFQSTRMLGRYADLVPVEDELVE